VALLYDDANVNEPTLDGTTPLHVAIADLSLKVVKAIIEQDADVNATSPKNGSTLRIAASRAYQSRQIMSVLLDAGALILPSQNTVPHPLLKRILFKFFNEKESIWLSHATIQKILIDGPDRSVRLLLQRIPDEPATDKKYGLLLHMTYISGDVDFAKFFKQRGVDVDATEYYYGSALQTAARMGHLEIAELLLSVDANVNLIGGRHKTAIKAAVTGKHSRMLELLANHNTDLNLKVNESSVSILLLAIEIRNRDIFQYLLDNGIDINDVSGEGQSCLISACAAKEMAMAESLLAKEAT
jgi:ankyrin repeat protein